MSPAPKSTITTSAVDVHKGEVLLMVSNTYPSLPLTAAECWQNAIDGGATKIIVVFDLRQRDVYIADNGDGVTPEKFQEALLSVGRSIKNRNKLGRFGRGLISPLGKCERYEFISQSGANNPPVQWTFEQARIRKMRTEVTIPTKTIGMLPAVPKPLGIEVRDLSERWRTMVIMRKLIDDRTLTSVDMDDFESIIRTKFGAAMFKGGISGRVVIRDLDGKIESRDIQPETFTGEPLGVYTVDAAGAAGKVMFELFRARKRNGKRTGVVTVCEMENLSGVRWVDFMRQVRMSGWDKLSEAFEALSSGHFEGVIKATGIELDPERTKFVYGDAVVDLYTVIDRWFEDVGRQQYDEEQRRSTEERLQEIGRRTMDKLREMLADSRYANLRNLLDNANILGLPEPVVQPNMGEDDDSDDTGGSSEGGAKGGGGSGGGKGSGGSSGSSGKGSRSPRTQPIGDPSLGLWISHEPFEFSSRLWEFDPSKGLLGINIAHPVWLMLDDTENPKRSVKNDRAVERLQLWLVLQALSLLSIPADMWDEGKTMIDLQIKPMAELFFV